MMSVQYISDSTGQTTGVFIPIKEWNELKEKYQVIEQNEISIPDWHKEIIDKRMRDYKNNPDDVYDFDEAMNDIEKSL